MIFLWIPLVLGGIVGLIAWKSGCGGKVAFALFCAFPFLILVPAYGSLALLSLLGQEPIHWVGFISLWGYYVLPTPIGIPWVVTSLLVGCYSLATSRAALRFQKLLLWLCVLSSAACMAYIIHWFALGKKFVWL